MNAPPARAGRPDVGQDRGARTTLIPRGEKGLAWLWPSIAVGALLLGLITAWTLGSGPGPNGGDGVLSPEPVRATRSTDEAHATPEQPNAEVPATPSKTAPRIVQEAQPGEAAVSPSATMPKTVSATVVPERNESKRALDITKASGNDAPVVPKKADVRSARDIRQLRIHPGVEHIANPDGGQPRGGIWPALTADNIDAWQIGDPAFIEINEKALVLSAGPNGNLLLTKRDTFQTGKLVLTMAATKGTEAYLALRAHRGPDGAWRAITVRITDEAGKIRVGHPSLDFQPPENGTKPEEYATEKFFWSFANSVSTPSKWVKSAHSDLDPPWRSWS